MVSLLWISLGVGSAIYLLGAVAADFALRVPRAKAPFPEQLGPGWRVLGVEVKATDGVSLRAAYVPSVGSKRCVIVLHGVGDSHAGALGFAGMFVRAGYHVLAPDSRGHGQSGGDLLSFGVKEAPDLLQWADWLRQEGCEKIFGLGESMGAAVLIQAAAKSDAFAAIVAECPFSDFRSIAEYRIVTLMGSRSLPALLAAKLLVSVGILHTRLLHGLDLNLASPVESARKLKAPLLLIHGLADTNIPASHSRTIAAAQPNASVWFVAEAGHVNASATEPVEFQRRVLAWFAQI